MEYPKLRNVQFFPVVVEGKRMGCLHDPMKMNDKPLLIPWRLVKVLPFLDGNHSFLDIQTEYMRQSGDILFKENLAHFLESLDHYLFLDSERFNEFAEKVKQGFLSSPVRPAFFSGMSYSSDPRVLLEELQGYFMSDGGPGWPEKREMKHTCHYFGTKEHENQPNPLPEGEGWAEGNFQMKKERIIGMIAPHIDLKSGGPCYAWAYHELINSSVMPDLFIILGTCHTEIEGLFAFTRKPFQTPLGEVKCDEEFICCLEQRYGMDLFSEEIVHRSEHTIEFQALFLKFLWEKFGADMLPLSICPVLIAFAPNAFSVNPSLKEIYDRFILSLKETISLLNKSVCIIASADMAHIGPKFGDYRALDQFERQMCLSEDHSLLEIIAQHDQEGFQKNILPSYDRRRICGYPPLTVMLDLLPHSKGKLLNQNYSVVDNQGSIVTYASMVFYEV